MPSPRALPLILIADDDVGELFVLRRCLEKAGVKNPVVTFSDADRLISFLRATNLRDTVEPSLRPAALFLDAKLRRSGTTQVLEWLKATPAMRRLSIIVTADEWSAPERAKFAASFGVRHFATKCPTASELQAIARHAHWDRE
jgi:CheY-like chemotaxis protein